MTNRISHPHPPGQLDGRLPMRDPHLAAVVDRRSAQLAEAAEHRLAALGLEEPKSTEGDPCAKPCPPSKGLRVRLRVARAFVAVADALDPAAAGRDTGSRSNSRAGRSAAG